MNGTNDLSSADLSGDTVQLTDETVASPVRLVYSEFGPPTAPPLIILHGFFASSRNWKTVAEKLAESRHVFAVDLRNHGASPHHPVMDYQAMADDVRGFLRDRGLSKASILGHSMGGKVAMWLALNTPEIVDRLIVADIAPVAYTHCFERTISALRSLPLSSITNRKQADEGLTDSIPELSYRQFLLQNLVLVDGHYRWRVDLDIFERAAPAVVGFPNAEACQPFTGPSLFVAGAESDFVKQEAVYPLFPGARIKVIDGAGHWVHVQQPEKFLSAIKTFLET